MSKEDQIPEKCDVIVIGSGAGGLTAAALLSQAGIKTIVFESQSQIGGYLAGFHRQGFQFNTSIEWLNHCAPGQFVSNIFRHLGGELPCFPPLHHIRRFKSDTFDYLLTSNPDDLRDHLIRDFPADEQGIRHFFADGKKLGQRLKLLDRMVMGLETVAPITRILRAVQMLIWALPIIKYIRTPVEQGLLRYFKSSGANKVFNSQETFMAVMTQIGWAFSGNYQACPKGGSRMLALWLLDRLKQSGAKVFLNQTVTRVLLNAKKEAIGIALADGRSVTANYVIAACDIQLLYERLLPNGCIPAKLSKSLQTADSYRSSFTVFLGIDCDPALLGFGEEAVNLSRSDKLRAEQNSGDPDNTLIVVMAPSVLDPSLAPAGKGTVTIHCPADFNYADNWQTGIDMKRGEEYQALKRSFAEILINRIEAIAPGLRKHIEVMEIATPITYWRYTGNAKGTTCGVQPTGKNIKAGIAHSKTPVKRLLLGGHCAAYGGGVPVAVKAAANASIIVLNEMNKDAYQKLKAVLNGKAGSALI